MVLKAIFLVKQWDTKPRPSERKRSFEKQSVTWHQNLGVRAHSLQLPWACQTKCFEPVRKNGLIPYVNAELASDVSAGRSFAQDFVYVSRYV